MQSDGPAWSFAVDPVAKQWSLYRRNVRDELFYWVEPRPFALPSGSTLKSIEVRVVRGLPTLLINGVDVVAPTGIAMPRMAESVYVGFGAGINPDSLTGRGDQFEIIIERTRLSELN